MLPWPMFNYIYWIVLIFGGYCFVRFFAEVFGDGALGIHRRMWQFMLALLVVLIITATAAPGFYDFYMSRFIQYFVAPVVLMTIVVTSIVTYVRRRDEESLWYMTGFVTFALFIIYSSVHYDLDVWFREHARNLYPYVRTFTRIST